MNSFRHQEFFPQRFPDFWSICCHVPSNSVIFPRFSRRASFKNRTDSIRLNDRNNNDGNNLGMEILCAMIHSRLQMINYEATMPRNHCTQQSRLILWIGNIIDIVLGSPLWHGTGCCWSGRRCTSCRFLCRLLCRAYVDIWCSVWSVTSYGWRAVMVRLEVILVHSTHTDINTQWSWQAAHVMRDNKRPDGTTLSPWSTGKPVAWDVHVRVPDTNADS